MLRAIPPFLRGRKGGGKYKNTPDTIRSEDSVEAILGVGEGENYGLAEGAKSFQIGGTALVNSNDEANFKDFQLTEYTGVSNPPAIIPALGGFGSPTAANASSLATNTAVVRTGQLTNIDYLDLRFLINQLHRSDDKGIYTWDLRIKIEYRQSLPAGQPWQLAWANVIPPPPGYNEDTSTPGVNVYTGGTTDVDYHNDIVTFEGDNIYMRADASPGAPIGDFTNIWTDGTGRPHIYSGGSWVPAPGSTDNGTYWSYGTTKFYKNPTTPPPNPSVGDVWTPPGSTEPLRWNGTSWIISLIRAIQSQAYAQPMMGTTNGVLSMTQKVTSPTVREVRVPVPRAGVPYDIRVTKLSEDTSTDGKKVSEVGWESFEEIVAEGKSFPDTHILHIIGRASDQFNSLPELTGDIKGRVVDVPTNYDPVTRTYAGIWDGLFKKAWTDNGAWCTRDFIKNNRYGLSTLYPYEVREASFYNWAVWCDTAVPDNKGGSRPRWTYNDVLDQPRQAKEQANYMAGSSGGRLIDDGSGIFDVLIDKDEPMTMVFGPESVVDGEFTYSFTDIQTRANWIKVGFVNPDLNWEVDFRVIKDQDHIDEYGRIPLEFVATGKTNVSEALAAGRLRLITGTTEYTAVTFQTNRVGKYLFPFKVIGICDPDMGWGVSGRLVEVTGAKQIRLRDPVYLEAGIGYKFVINRATSPITTAEMTVVPGQTGALTTINFVEDLPADLPEFAQFAIESYDGTGDPIATPKAFKILTITPADGDSELVEITALELNRAKWAYVDGTGELLPAEEYSSFKGDITKPQNVSITPTTETVGGVTKRNLQVEWDQPSNPFARNTLIEYSRDGNNFVQVGESETEFYEVRDVSSGVHAVRLTHVHIDGVRKSLPVTAIHEITSEYRLIPPVASLVLADEPSASVFESISPMFRWEHGEEDPNFKTYRVRIRNASTNAIVRTEDVAIREFIYEFDKNKVDFGGTPSRTFKVCVCKVDDYGSESAEVTLTASNTAPAAPTLTITGAIGGVNVTLSPTTERDVVGARLQVDTALIPLELQLDAAQSNFFVPLPDNATRLIKGAYYDRFSKTSVNWSAQSSAARELIDVGDIDTTPPADVTGLAVTAPTVTLDSVTGQPVVKLVATWTANTEPDLYGYETEITDMTNGGQPIVQAVGTNRNEWMVLGNTSYRISVRAVDRLGNRSGWCASVTQTSGKDSSAPAVVSGFSATGLFGSIALAWANATAADLAAVEVWENTTNNSGTATRIATVAARSSAPGTYVREGLGVNQTRYYWLKSVDNSGNASGFSAVASASTVKVASGDITSITASQISDTLAATQIPGLDANKIISGTLDIARIAAGAIDASKFATSIKPIEIVSSLPTTGLTAGRTVFLTTDGKIYRYNGGWTADVAATNITGQLTNAQIAALDATKLTGQITSTQITDNAITTVKIAANAITAGQVAAGSILASKLAIGDSSNMFPDPNCQDTGCYYGATFSLTAVSDPVASVRAIVVNAGQILYPTQAGIVAVEPGKPYYISGAMWGTGTLQWIQYTHDGSSYNSYNGGTVVTSNDGNLKRGSLMLTMPSVVRGLSFRWTATTGAAWFAEPVIRRAANGELIVDGSITATKIQAGTITGDRLVAGTITAAQIAASTITGTQIAAGTITANKLVLTSGGYMNVDPMFNDASVIYVESGTFTIQTVSDAPVGNKVLRSGAGGGYFQGGDYTYYAIDPAKTYRFRFFARRSSDCNGILYGDLRQYTAPGSPCASNGGRNPYKPAGVTVPTTWTEYSNTYGPSDWQSGVKMVALDWLLNYNGTAGYMEICYPRLEEMVAAELIVDGSVVADKIAANAIIAGKIAAGAVTASKLTIGDTSNMVPDPTFTDPAAFYLPWGGSGVDVTSQPIGSAGIMYLPYNSVETYGSTKPTPVEPLKPHFVGGFLSSQSATQVTLYVEYFSDIAGTSSNGYQLIGLTTSSARVNAIVTTPAGTRSMRLTAYRAAGGSGYVYFGEGVIRRAANGELIVDGSITAGKIAANSITSSQIQAGSITGDRLVAGTITAVQIAARTVRTDHLTVSGTNLIANSDFSTGDFTNWRPWTWITTPVIQKIDYFNSQYWARYYAGTTGVFAAAKAYADPGSDKDGFEAKAGEEYRVTIDAFRNGGGDVINNFIIYVYWQRADGTYTASSAVTWDATGSASLSSVLNGTTTAASYGGNVTAPIYAIRGWAYVYAEVGSGSLYWTRLNISRRASGSLIVDGAITAAKIQAGSITGDRIAANAITSTLIAANSIKASHLTLTASGPALNADPYMTDINAWTALSSATIVPITDGTRTGYAMRGANQDGPREQRPIPVDRNKTYRVRGSYRKSAGATGVCYMTVHLYDANLNEISGDGSYWFYFVSGQAGSTAWTTVEAKFGATGARIFPSNAAYMRPGMILNYYAGTALTGYFEVTDLVIQEAVNASLIVDGSITASHIQAGSITGDRLAANTITSTQILAGSITADRMNVSSLSAISANLGAVTAGSININNKFIVASDGTLTIQNAASGARLVVTNSLIQVYDASNVLRVRLGIW